MFSGYLHLFQRLEPKVDFCVACQAVTHLSMLQSVALQIRAI